MGTGTSKLLVGGGIAAATTLVIDQASKAATRVHLEPGETRDVALGGTVGVGHIQNHGSAYGLVGEMPTWVPAVGTVAFGGALLALGAGSRMPLAGGVAAGLVIGGGVGNVIDRAHQGHVTDMLHTSDAFGYYNVADAAVIGGLVAGAALVLFAR